MTRTARPVPKWLWFAGVGAGCLLGLGLHWMLPNPIIGRDTPALAETRSMLGCFEQRLAEFSAAAATFSEAQFQDRDAAMVSLRPLKPIIENENAAYAALSRNRFRLLADISSQGGRDRDLREVSHLLQQVDEFQWKRLRPTENELLVDIVAVWQGSTDASTIARIHAQQRDGWVDLREILALGSRQFRPPVPNDRCDAAAPE